MAIWAISPSVHGQSIIETTTTPNVPWSLVLFTFLAMSRFGVWVYDMTTSQLTQTLVPERRRSSFAGVENSVVNVFEVLGASAAIAMPRPEQFKWLSLASFLAVLVSWVMYALWLRGQRGHLLHWEKLGKAILTRGR
jgi:solute carrier family 40 (iron-regulated transporter), member 1